MFFGHYSVAFAVSKPSLGTLFLRQQTERIWVLQMPRGDKRLVLRFSENMSTRYLGASKEFVDPRDTKW